MKKLKMMALSVALVGTLAAGSQAAIVSWNASAAVIDPYGWNFGHPAHAIWMPGNLPFVNEPRMVFEGGIGTFDEYLDDTTNAYQKAHLYGVVHDIADANNKWNVDVWFTATGPGAGSPHKELQDHAYVENGGPVDPSTWRYYHMNAGQATFTGLGVNAGKSLFLQELPEDLSKPFQVGVGANGKNTQMGASGWFKYAGSYQGEMADFNIDLTNPVPEPSTMILLGTGLAAGLIRSRKKIKA